MDEPTASWTILIGEDDSRLKKPFTTRPLVETVRRLTAPSAFRGSTEIVPSNQRRIAGGALPSGTEAPSCRRSHSFRSSRPA